MHPEAIPPKSGNGVFAPRIIIHGGAGNITRKTLPRDRYDEYQSSLHRILTKASELLSVPGISSLDVATYAVTQLEDDPLYNSGKGAVFTRAGVNELECSIMVSNGYRKRGVGCMMLKHVKNPIKLARELLIRGEDGDGGGAQDHCQYSGEFAESLAKEWGLEMVEQEYFWTKRKWDEHKRGLAEERTREQSGLRPGEMTEWEKNTYVPLGTCGAVVVDSFGTICVATSTGGLTNKVPGRIGDTPTLGCGFWAEEWFDEAKGLRDHMVYQPSAPSPMDRLSRGDVRGLVQDCLPSRGLLEPISDARAASQAYEKPLKVRHAVGISGTGNGDSVIRLCASRTTAAYSRFSHMSLSAAATWMAGPGGELQKSAGDRWGKVHEGVGGMIGIEVVDKDVKLVCDYNCGGMFRAWVTEDGAKQVRIFRKDSWESGP